MKKLVPQAMMSCSTGSRHIGEVDADVAIRAQEQEGERRDKRRKKVRRKKNLPFPLVSVNIKKQSCDLKCN